MNILQGIRVGFHVGSRYAKPERRTRDQLNPSSEEKYPSHD